MKRKQFEKKYKRLAIKYGLPSLNEIEKEVGYTIEPKEDTLNNIIRGLNSPIDFLKNNYEELLTPQKTSFKFEHNFFKEEELDEIFENYKKLMAFERELTKTVFQNEKGKSEGIKAAFNLLKKIKPYAIKLMDRLNKGWEEYKKPAQQDAIDNSKIKKEDVLYIT